MAIQSKILDLLPDNYGYVVLVGAGSIFLNIWMIVNVVRARKLYKIEVGNWYCEYFAADDVLNDFTKTHRVD